MWFTSLITSLGAFLASSSESRSSADFTSLIGPLRRVKYESVFAKHVGSNHAMEARVNPSTQVQIHTQAQKKKKKRTVEWGETCVCVEQHTVSSGHWYEVILPQPNVQY
jgi:hypothetical protein